MRGLALGVLALTGLYLATSSGSGQIATALAVPTGWLRKWADPSVPLIGAGAGPAAPPAAAPHPKSGPPKPRPGHNPIARRGPQT